MNNLKKSEGKSCTCSTGKKCSDCKKLKTIKPVVYIEEPRRLPTSIVISRLNKKRNQQQKTEENKKKQIKKLYTEEKKKVEQLKKLYSEEKKRILKQRQSDERKFKKEQHPSAAKKRLPSLRSWYWQRKALIPLEHDRRKEGQDKEKVSENEFLCALVKQAKEEKKAHQRVKEREATAKPLAHSKYASAKHATEINKTLTYRFVNFCNKLCCQCYCYFSIIFILGIMFLYLL